MGQAFPVYVSSPTHPSPAADSPTGPEVLGWQVLLGTEDLPHCLCFLRCEAVGVWLTVLLVACLSALWLLSQLPVCRCGPAVTQMSLDASFVFFFLTLWVGPPCLPELRTVPPSVTFSHPRLTLVGTLNRHTSPLLHLVSGLCSASFLQLLLPGCGIPWWLSGEESSCQGRR